MNEHVKTDYYLNPFISKSDAISDIFSNDELVTVNLQMNNFYEVIKPRHIHEEIGDIILEKKVEYVNLRESSKVFKQFTKDELDAFKEDIYKINRCTVEGLDFLEFFKIYYNLDFRRGNLPEQYFICSKIGNINRFVEIPEIYLEDIDKGE